MKVYISGYESWWTSYDFELWLSEKLGLSENAAEKIAYPYHLFCQLMNAITPKRKEWIKIDRYDSWSADHTLALIIAPVLKQLRDTKHGSPYIDNEDVPEEYRLSEKDEEEFNHQWNEEVDKKFHARWDWVMNEMVWAFEEYNKDWEEQFRSGVHDIYWEKIVDPNNPLSKTGGSEMKIGPNDTYKYDHEGAEKHRTRIMNGIRLFAKYYPSLWD